jgi:mRNA-degrading endonuclease RelE of RelBE toxin-antitoxin system
VRYDIELTRNAEQDYLSLDARWRANIKAALEVHLRHEPTKQSKSRIKRLRELDQPQYRLRVDEYRIFYDVTEALVIVHAIVPKDEADAWLAQFGVKSND